MTDIFIVLVEESNVETTERDIQVFSSLQECHTFLQTKVTLYKSFRWPKNIRPPPCPAKSDLESLTLNELHTVYEFEYQTPHNDFFCNTLFVKKMKL